MKHLFTMLVLVGLLGVLAHQPANAEPWLAVKKGLKCMVCHTNPTGGGKRNVYGNIFAQNELAARRIEIPELTTTSAGGATGFGHEYWTGELNRFLSIGGDLRNNYTYTDIPNRDNTSEFDTEEVLLYVDFSLIPGRLSFYIDEKVAPGGAENREAYALFWMRDNTIYLKAGKMFLPYGFRLEDDTAFIRRVPGINYQTPDNGVEAGLEVDAWTINFAITNGSAGGSETDDGKQYSLLGSYTSERWRIGSSLNYNDLDGGDRKMGNIFAGLRTGPVNWLGEVDFIRDEGTPTGERDMWVGLIEASWLITKGLNLKLTGEYFEPDTDVSNDDQSRGSIVVDTLRSSSSSSMRATATPMAYRKMISRTSTNISWSYTGFSSRHRFTPGLVPASVDTPLQKAYPLPVVCPWFQPSGIEVG